MGTGKSQPGGWVFNILPQLEQANLYNLGLGKSDAALKAELGKMIATPLSMLNCPSRRQSVAYKLSSGYTVVNADRPALAGRSDYGANSGDSSAGTPAVSGDYGPSSLANAATYTWPQMNRTGVIFQRSETTAAHIRDGLSNTYLLGEKYLNPDHYTTGGTADDDQHMYTGYDRDTCRLARNDIGPGQDRPGSEQTMNYGSAHSGGFFVSFCDGSVRPISYSIDLTTHARLANRKDGEVVGTIP